jgi:hypothetical protein
MKGTVKSEDSDRKDGNLNFQCYSKTIPNGNKMRIHGFHFFPSLPEDGEV